MKRMMVVGLVVLFHLFVLIVLGVLAIALPFRIAYLIRERQTIRAKCLLSWVMMMMVGFLWLVVMVLHPFGPEDRLRILDQTETGDHTKIVLAQARNWKMYFLIPYTTGLWIKPQGKLWGWFLIDSCRWWPSGKVEIQTGTLIAQAVVKRGDKTYFTLDLRKFASGEEKPDVWMDEGWEPREGGKYEKARAWTERME